MDVEKRKSTQGRKLGGLDGGDGGGWGSRERMSALLQPPLDSVFLSPSFAILLTWSVHQSESLVDHCGSLLIVLA